MGTPKLPLTSLQKCGDLVFLARKAKCWSRERVVRAVNQLLTAAAQPMFPSILEKLENKKLRRAMSDEKVTALCKVLEITPETWQKATAGWMPLDEGEDLGSYNILPFVKKLGNMPSLVTLTWKQLCQMCIADRDLSQVGVTLSDHLATETPRPTDHS